MDSSRISESSNTGTRWHHIVNRHTSRGREQHVDERIQPRRLQNSKQLNLKQYERGIYSSKITKDIKIMDDKTDKEESIIALKILINKEELTVVPLYDANTNTDCHLTELDRY